MFTDVVLLLPDVVIFPLLLFSSPLLLLLPLLLLSLRADAPTLGCCPAHCGFSLISTLYAVDTTRLDRVQIATASLEPCTPPARSVALDTNRPPNQEKSISGGPLFLFFFILPTYLFWASRCDCGRISQFETPGRLCFLQRCKRALFGRQLDVGWPGHERKLFSHYCPYNPSHRLFSDSG
ncbi:hypothetical protein VTN02DRAFT_1896 [Thermoascus thermophilus]